MSCVGCGKYPKNHMAPNTAGPTPFYEEVAPDVIEKHGAVIENLSYAAGFYVQEQWVIPNDEGEVSVTVPDLTYVPVGAYLYNPQYGYFKVVAWNPETKLLGLRNERIQDTQAPGTSVPAQTLFFMAAKPCCEDDSSTLFPFLAADFVAPAVAASLTIDVTSTFGLRLGDVVRIGTGVYRLEQILSSLQVVIKNEGAGVTPGDTVSAKNASGEFQYLIVSENTSPCSASDVLQGRLIVCDSNNERILRGQKAGQVPVLTDVSGDIVTMQFLDASIRTCAEITSPITISPANLTYVFAVPTSAGFTINDIIQVDEYAPRFIVTALGPTSITANSTPSNPTVTINVLAGSFLCKALTTELILQELSGSSGGFNAAIANLQTQINTLNSSITTLSTGLGTEQSNRINGDATITVNYQAADATLQANLNTETTNRTNADSTIVTNYTTADAGLLAGYLAGDTTEANARIAGDSAEATTRAANDAAIDAKINNHRVTAYAQEQTVTTGSIVATDAAYIYGNQTDCLLQNASPTQSMSVKIDWHCSGFGNLTTAGSNIQSEMMFGYQVDIDIAAIGASSVTVADSTHRQQMSKETGSAYTAVIAGCLTSTYIDILTPGQEIRIGIRPFWKSINLNAGTVTFTNQQLHNMISGIGVALA